MADQPKPSADDLLGPPPSADSILGPPPASNPVLHGIGWDDVYTQHEPFDRIMSAMGQGARQGWGQGDLGIEPGSPLENALKGAGIFADLKKGQAGPIRALNEAVIRPLAAGLDALWRGSQAIIGGAQAGAAEAAREMGASESLARDIGAAPEAFPLGGAELGGLAPHVPEPARAAPEVKPLTNPLPEAANMNIVGGTEGAFDGTEPPKPVPNNIPEGVKDAVQAAHEASAEITPAAPAPTPPTLDSVARGIAPDTFREYDDLAQRRDALRDLIDVQTERLRQNADAQAPGQAEIAQLQARLADATPRLAKKYQARLDELIPARDAFLDSDQYALLTRDTNMIAEMRSQLLAADFRMRDLAPDVSAAYRQAAEQFPAEQPASLTEPEGVAGETAPHLPVVAPEEIAPKPAASSPAGAPEETSAREAIGIAEDVAAKLQAAGRPAEEAHAAGQLIQAHYEARAARFNGARGTGADLYQKTAPAILKAERGGRGGMAAGKYQPGKITLFAKADASTFLHETGHHWLNELLEDADHKLAPPDLVRDAQTVRDWIGLKEGDRPTTRQHERFARGFERYMMEGVAPSPSIATVFRRFSSWLRQIYASVRGAGAPISDAIRDVFDRLLTNDPKRVVIGPETEAPRSEPIRVSGDAERVTGELAKLHTEDARTADSADAAETADHVEREIERTAAEHAPDAIPARPAEAGLTPRPELDQTSAGSANAAGSDLGGQAGIREPGNVNAGAGGPAAEGNRLSSEPAAKSGSSGATTLDRAGNIRLDKLNAPDDVKRVIQETAEQNGGFLSARRGQMSIQETIDLADALGMDAHELSRRQIGQAFNAEQIVAARKLLVQSATDVMEKAKLAAEGTDQDVLAFAAAAARHRMIQEQVSGITAEAGRALQAFRQMEGIKEAGVLSDVLAANTGQTLYQMRQAARQAAQLNPAQTSRFIDAMSKPGFWDMALEYWLNAILSGPMTHATYAVGNMITNLIQIPERAAAAMVGKAMGSADRVRIGEAGELAYGLISGSVDGARAAWAALKTGETPLLPGEARQFGAPKAIPGVVGEIVRSPQRMISGIHGFARAQNYVAQIRALAFRQAIEEGHIPGTQAFAQRVATLQASPSEAMMEAARGTATETALMGRGGRIAELASEISNLKVGPVPVGKFLLPFVKIGGNILRQGLMERTPLGMLDAEVRANVLGHNGPIEQQLQLGRIAVGTTALIAAGYLAANSDITGSGPADPKQMAAWKLMGYQPYSVNLGGHWFSYARLGPFAKVLALAADGTVAAGHMAEGAWNRTAEDIANSVVKGFADDTWVRGLSDVVNAISDPRERQFWFQHELASFVPFSSALRQVNSYFVDPYSRQAKTAMDTVKAGLPYFSQELMPRRDIWGQPIINPHWSGNWDAWFGDRQAQMQADPVNRKLDELGKIPHQVRPTIRGVALDPQQADEYTALAGQTAKMRLDALIDTPGFDALPKGVQSSIVTKTIEHARQGAQTAIMMRHPEIIEQAIENKQAMVR